MFESSPFMYCTGLSFESQNLYNVEIIKVHLICKNVKLNVNLDSDWPMGGIGIVWKVEAFPVTKISNWQMLLLLWDWRCTIACWSVLRKVSPSKCRQHRIFCMEYVLFLKSILKAVSFSLSDWNLSILTYIQHTLILYNALSLIAVINSNDSAIQIRSFDTGLLCFVV